MQCGVENDIHEKFSMSYKDQLRVSDACSVLTTMNRWAETERRDRVYITTVSRLKSWCYAY
jgi:hypothetical protein